MNGLRSLGGIFMLCVLALDLANAYPNLLRGRRGRNDDDDTDLESSLVNYISARIEKLLVKLNSLQEDNTADADWYEFYDDDNPVGNYTLNETSVIEKRGNYSIQMNTSIIVMQLTNGSKALFITEDFNDADANDECNGDRDCDENQFCTSGVFYGTECRRCIDDDGVCIRNEQCCDDSICYFGRCTPGAIEGEVGAACSTIDDCGEGMCCATMSGSSIQICKPFARITETCDSGFQSWLYTILGGYPPTDCPCEGSLKCQEVGYFISENVCVEEDRTNLQQNSETSELSIDSDRLLFDPLD